MNREPGETDPGTVEVIVGYLVTLADGYEVRFGPTHNLAVNYAIRQRVKPPETMFVKRKAEDAR
jgi:hypothetical protein